MKKLVHRKTPELRTLGNRNSREKLPIQKEPHWAALAVRGTALGYYKGTTDRSWFVRQRVAGSYVKTYLGRVDDYAPADGEVVLTCDQALTKARDAQLEKRTPAPRHYADGVTLNVVMERYIEDHLGRKSSKGMTRQQWKRHGEGDIGTKLVSALDASQLTRWLNALTTKPPTVRGKVQPFDPEDPDQVRSREATANRILTNVKAALNWGRKTGKLIPHDAPQWWSDVTPFRLGQETRPTVLKAPERQRLLNAAPADFRELLTGALMTGARRGELVALRCGDFDPDTGTVRIYQSKTKKTLTNRLSPEGREFFDSITAGRDPDEHVFLREDGRPWKAGDVQKPMAAVVKAAGLKGVSFKTMRSTYGKIMLDATNGDMEMVAKFLGHSDSRITRKHYAEYDKEDMARAADNVPRLGISIDRKVTRIGGRKS